MSSSPPCMFTSRACAFSMMMRPLASCHLACTGTITGKRLPRRCSVFFGGGVTSSSTRAVPQPKGTRLPLLEDAQTLNPGSNRHHVDTPAAVVRGRPVAADAAEKADPVHDLKILSARMEKDRSGTTAVWLVDIDNKSKAFSYSKIQYETTYVGPDNAALLVNKGTIPFNLAPGEEENAQIRDVLSPSGTA